MYLQQPDSEHNPKVDTRTPLQGLRPGLPTSQATLEPGSTSHLGRREGPRHVPDRAKPAALESVLDRLDREGIFGAEEALPARRELAGPRVARDKILEVEGGEDGGQEALQELESLEEEGVPEEVVERGGRLGSGGRSRQVREEVGVPCCEDGQEDGDEGEGRRKREGELDAVDVFVAGGTSQYLDTKGFLTLPKCFG